MFIRRPSRRLPRSVRPWLELLEDRCVLSTFTVNSLADTAAPPAGTVTLRSAITQAEADQTPDTINFAAALNGQTITLNSSLPTLTNGETISGPGPTNLTVNAAADVTTGDVTSPFFNVFNTASLTSVTISGLTISGGTVSGTDGGGILNTGSLVLNNDVITDNEADFPADGGTSGGFGGGVANDQTDTALLASLTVTNTVLSNNYADGGGGAINNSGSATITMSTVNANSVTFSGGGGGIFNNFNGNLTINDSTVANNVVLSENGGGLDSFGNLMVNDSTFTGNAAQGTSTPSVGGILRGASTSNTFILNNTIVAGNTVAAGTSPDISGAVSSGDGNFIGQADTSLNGISNNSNGNQIGTAANVLNPLLGPLQNNGGPTPTELPLVGSPVINTGVNIAVVPGLTTDQRGFLRIVGPTVDIGATEFQPAALTTLGDNPGTITFGQSTTLTATVRNTSPAPNNPLTGSVSFFNGTTLIGSSPLNLGNGTATISFDPSSAGTFALTAVFNSTGAYPPSPSAPVQLQVNPQPTTTGLTVSAASVVFGNSVTLTATVSPTAPVPSGTLPTGTVTFFNGPTPLGSAAVNAATGVATITFTPSATGNDTLGAGYSGDGNFVASTAPAVPLQVTPAPTSTALTVSPPSITLGQALTLTATVTVLPDPPLTGSVTFANGSTPLGTVPVNSNGVATLTFTPSAPGTLQLSATYSGANNFSSSASMTVPVAVGPPAQTIGVFNYADETWYLKNSNSPGAPDIAPFQYGGFGWDGLTGHWNGPGQDTIAVVNPDTETWYIKFSNGPGAPDIAPFQYGAPLWIPLAGDWNGTGQDTIAVVDPTTMTWYIKFSNSPGAPDIAPFQFGPPGSTPVVGDWNGTGHDGIGVYDSSTGTWYLRNEDNAGAPDAGVFQYGGIGWTPVVGNWSGNGKSTVGVFDVFTGTWYIKFTNTPGAPDIAPFQYGGATTWEAFAGAWQLQAGQRLQADFAGDGQSSLDNATLQTAVSAALSRLKAAGVNSSLVRQLASVQFEISNSLPPDTLALSFVGADLVEVSATAAGRGWFTDASASSDAEYVNGTAQPNTPAATGMDLLTTVLHEMGHFNGRVDLPASATAGLMADVLSASQRDVQGLDQVFATGF